MQELETYEERATDKNKLSLNEFILSLSSTLDLDSLKNCFSKSSNDTRVADPEPDHE